MEDTLISFETAKLAKEKGFEPSVSNHIYNEEGKLLSPIDHMGLIREQDCIQDYFKIIKSYPNACTQSLLQKWLREVHNCFIDILPHKDGDSKNKQWKSKKDVFWTVEVNYYGKIFEIELTDESDFIQHFNNSYEEALEIGLQEALKLIK